MNLNKLLDPQNPKMALIWSFANSQHSVKKKNSKEYRELLSVDVADTCGKLKEEIIGSSSELMANKAFFRASMVTSGALRLHNKQTDILLDDTMKLLEDMRREKKALGSLEENLDCITTEQMLDFDLLAAAPVTTTLPAAATAPSRQQQIDWGSLDEDIDWTLGPPRALPHQITLPNPDVPPSTTFVAELERLRGLEASLEGPTLVDWEEELSREGSLKLAEEKPDESITEAPVDTAVAPAASEEPTKILVEEVPDILPPVVEGLETPVASEPQAELQATEEQPSQIELGPLEGKQEPQVPFRRVRRGRPVTDSSKYLSNDFIRVQIQSHLDTLRNMNAYEDVINLERLKLDNADFFGPKPKHRRVMADTLLRLFRPCDSEAPLPDPESPLPEIVRHASHVEERDLSAIPSFLQDTSSESLQRSSTLITEAPPGLLEDATHTLQPIEEHEVTGAAAPPLPSPPAGDMQAPVKEQVLKKTKRVRKGRDADIDGTAQPTRDSDASKQASYEASSSDTSKEVLPGLKGEELYDQSLAEPEVMARMVFEHLAAHQETFFSNLLPQDPTDRDAALLYELLLEMYKDGKLRLMQDCVFGPIKVMMAQANKG